MTSRLALNIASDQIYYIDTRSKQPRLPVEHVETPLAQEVSSPERRNRRATGAALVPQRALLFKALETWGGTRVSLFKFIQYPMMRTMVLKYLPTSWWFSGLDFYLRCLEILGIS